MATEVTRALIAELGRRTSVCWLRYPLDGGPESEHPAWHVWHDDALLLVSGGEEQQLPGIEEADRVAVTMRSKENGGRLVTWVGDASTIRPGTEEWAAAAAALAAARLSIPSLTETPRSWAQTSVVTRVRPAEVLDEPGSLPTGSLAAPPRPTTAGTRGRLPRVLHRRQRRDRPLS